MSGGASWHEDAWTWMDTTEILETPGGSWRTLTTARLPSGRTGPRAATVNNVVFLFGKNCLTVWYFPGNISWQEDTMMKNFFSTRSSPSIQGTNPGSQQGIWLFPELSPQLRWLIMIRSSSFALIHEDMSYFISTIHDYQYNEKPSNNKVEQI